MRRPFLLVLLPGIALWLLAQQPNLRFQHFIVDNSAQRPMDIWGKAVGDLNGDGKPDLLAGGHRANGLVWYQNTADMHRWPRHSIAASGSFSTDIEVADLDKDGDLDVVTINNGLVWFENPGPRHVTDADSWKSHRIAGSDVHDLEIADLDGDSWLDIVARNQAEWGKGDTLFIHRHNGSSGFLPALEVAIPDGEGLLVVDLDSDNRPDIVVNGVWLENQNSPAHVNRWKSHSYAAGIWRNLFLAAGDMNGDGRLDIVAAPSEREHHPDQPLQWFQAPPAPHSGAAWIAHTVATIQPVRHFCGVADFDGDGSLDVATASMTQGRDPDYVTIYRSLRRGQSWHPVHLAESGSHSMRIADLNGDAKPDLYGANWNTKASPNGAPVEIWLNLH